MKPLFNLNRLIRLAVHLVQAVKTVTIDSKVDDLVVVLLAKLVPRYGAIIRYYHRELEELLPIWLQELEAAGNALDAEPSSIIEALQQATNPNTDYNHLATRCLYFLSGGADGLLQWADCKNLVEECYQQYIKKKH